MLVKSCCAGAFRVNCRNIRTKHSKSFLVEGFDDTFAVHVVVCAGQRRRLIVKKPVKESVSDGDQLRAGGGENETNCCTLLYDQICQKSHNFDGIP